MEEFIVRKYKHEIYAVYSKISKTIKRVYLRKEDYTSNDGYQQLLQINSRFEIMKPIKKFYLRFNTYLKTGSIELTWSDEEDGCYLGDGDRLFMCRLKDDSDITYWEVYDYNKYAEKGI